jgi:inorganic phosphate transporter, PiT family
MTLAFLLFAVAFLAYSNGANDNFKGVASLYGSRTTSYRTALTWATVTTFAGSVCSIVLAQSLLSTFSGNRLVPDQFVGSQDFLLAVSLGAGATVMLATAMGLPISTTHGLTGAIVGAGLAAARNEVDLGVLRQQFLLPLLLSPLVAVLLGAAVYVTFRFVRLRFGITKELCLCVGTEQRLVALPQPLSLLSVQSMPTVTLSLDTDTTCSERYAGSFLGINCQAAMDAGHFLSAGAVSFARGLNDTPKIAALLIIVHALDIRAGMLLIALAIAIGGWMNARRVAETMSQRITRMNHGQGFAANVTTALLVIGATRLGLPVSTTHVSVGALFGIGLTTGQAHRRVIAGILLSWFVTLPCAAVIAGSAYWSLSRP